MPDDHPHPHAAAPGGRRPEAAPDDTSTQALAEALRSSFGFIKFVMIILVVVFLASGFFTVKPQERAIILRMGKPIGGANALLGPGPHWSWPYPIDEIERIPTTELQKVISTSGWFATTPDQERLGIDPAPQGALNPVADGYVLTSDENIVHVRATIAYRIQDPIRFRFAFTNAPQVVLQAANNAIIYSAARYKVDDILNRDIAGFKEAVRQRVSYLVEKDNVGVVIEQCDVLSRAPLLLKDHFNSVLNAEVERSKKIADARTYENTTISRAGADSNSIVNIARSESTRNVESVRAESEWFLKLLPHFQANPELFVQQRLMETVETVMTNSQDKFFLSERGDRQARELRVLLNREFEKQKSPAAAPK